MSVRITNEMKARRQERRARRQQKLAQQIAEAIRDTQDFSRHAFTYGQKDVGGRKILGHPGIAASSFVSEALGQYEIQGTIESRYLGMHREAGRGGHEILDGTIVVGVDITPIQGVKQSIEVPITVKSGRMQEPGIFFFHKNPMVMSQSALTEVMDAGFLEDMPELDRQNMFSPPPTAEEQHARNVIWANKKIAQVSVEISIPETGEVIRQGQFVELVDLDGESAHVRTVSGVEARISREYLK